MTMSTCSFTLFLLILASITCSVRAQLRPRTVRPQTLSLKEQIVHSFSEEQQGAGKTPAVELPLLGSAEAPGIGFLSLSVTESGEHQLGLVDTGSPLTWMMLPKNNCGAPTCTDPSSCGCICKAVFDPVQTKDTREFNYLVTRSFVKGYMVEQTLPELASAGKFEVLAVQESSSNQLYCGLVGADATSGNALSKATHHHGVQGFGIYMNPQKMYVSSSLSAQPARVGTLVLGEIVEDNTFYAGDLTWSSAASTPSGSKEGSNYWDFALVSADLRTSDSDSDSDSSSSPLVNQDAIIDSGAQEVVLLSMPLFQRLAAWFKKTPGLPDAPFPRWQNTPCSIKENIAWPTLSLTFSELETGAQRTLTLGPDDYFAPYSNPTKPEIKNECRWKLAPWGSKTTTVLGTPFLQRYFTHFNYDPPKIGFALATHQDGSASDDEMPRYN